MSERLETVLRSLDDLDYTAPIVGSFVLSSIPEGSGVPSEVRKQWPGKRLPIRYPEQLELGDVQVTPADIEATLMLEKGDYQMYQWYDMEHLSRRPYSGRPFWTFATHEGEVDLGARTNARTFYAVSRETLSS